MDEINGDYILHRSESLCAQQSFPMRASHLIFIRSDCWRYTNARELVFMWMSHSVMPVHSIAIGKVQDSNFCTSGHAGHGQSVFSQNLD